MVNFKQPVFTFVFCFIVQVLIQLHLDPSPLCLFYKYVLVIFRILLNFTSPAKYRMWRIKPLGYFFLRVYIPRANYKPPPRHDSEDQCYSEDIIMMHSSSLSRRAPAAEPIDIEEFFLHQYSKPMLATIESALRSAAPPNNAGMAPPIFC